MRETSPWLPIGLLVHDEFEGETDFLNYIGNLIGEKSSIDQWGMAILGMLHIEPKRPVKTQNFSNKLLTKIVAYLLQKIFISNEQGATDRSFTIEEDLAGFHLNALKQSSTFVTEKFHDKYFVVDGGKLNSFIKRHLENNGISVDFGSDSYFADILDKEHEISLQSIVDECGGMKSSVLTHFQNNRNFNGITIKKTKRRISLDRSK